MICDKHKCEKVKYEGNSYGIQDIFYICPGCRQEIINDPNAYKEDFVTVKTARIDEIINYAKKETYTTWQLQAMLEDLKKG